MGLIAGLFRALTGLIGMVLMFAAVCAFFYGAFLILTAVFGSSSGNLSGGLVFFVGSMVVAFIATIIGNFSRGDYSS